MSDSEPVVVPTRAQRLAPPLMGLSALGQGVLGSLLTMAAALSLGSVAYMAISYRGGLTSTEEEVAAAGVGALLLALVGGIFLVSTVSAAYSSVAVAFRWRGYKPFVASALSVVGPLLMGAFGALNVMAMGSYLGPRDFSVAVALTLVVGLVLILLSVFSMVAAAVCALGLGQTATASP